VRVEQSRQGLAGLRSGFRHWLNQRRNTDNRKRHGRQFDALGHVVEGTLDAIDATLNGFESLPTRQAYEECRRADTQCAFVRRLWTYFREKWDQRDDPSLAAVLAAADEVVWSCYRPPFRRLDRTGGPIPLTYVAPELAAHAIGRHAPPSSLRHSDDLLRQTVAELPVPLIGLPYSCVEGPWWLVLVAHEVGHQVAYAITEADPKSNLSDLIGAAVAEAGAEPASEREWRSWSQEIFADAYATMMVGAAHLWALVELEQGSDEAMARELPSYPPPLIRHELVASLLERLGLLAADAVPAPPPGLVVEKLEVSDTARERIERLLEMVPVIAETLINAELADGCALPELAAWAPRQLSRDTGAGWWQEQFHEDQAAPEAELVAARLATVGGLAEWASIAEEREAAARSQRADSLRTQMLAVLPESAEPGHRASKPPVSHDVRALTERLAQEVLELPAEDFPAELSVTR
jgi:hypothetical protein